MKKHHGDINNASDECRIDEVSWDFKKQIKDILDNTIDELNQIYDKYLEGKNIEAFLNWLDDESNLKSIKKEFRKKKYNIEDLLLCEYVYSLLLTGDKSQLIRNDAYIPDKQYPLGSAGISLQQRPSASNNSLNFIATLFTSSFE